MSQKPTTTDSSHRTAARADVWRVVATAFPVVVTTSSRALMDVVDYIMLTSLRDNDVQAAILPAQMMMWTLIVFGMGVVSVVNTYSSQCLGRGAKKESGIYGWQVLYLAIIGMVAGFALKPFLPNVIQWFGHESGVQAAEFAYANIALLSVGPTVAAAGLGWFFIGIHRPWVTMWSVVEANVVNVVVSYVLIFGCLGFESMGIAGAAWGTLAAVCYRTLRLTITLITPHMHREFQTRHTWRPVRRRIWDIVRLGCPCGLHYTCEVVVWALFVNILIGSRFGTEALIATNIAWQYMRLAFMPTLGVGQALTAMVGKAIGAGDPQLAMQDTRLAIRLTFGYMGLLSLVYLLMGARLVGWFNDDPEIMAMGRWIMVCAAVFQLFDAFGIAYDSALRGAGDTFVPATFFVVSAWVIIIGGGWAMIHLVPNLGCLGPWIAASAFIIAAAVFLRWRWHSRVWMGVDLLGEEVGASASGDLSTGSAAQKGES